MLETRRSTSENTGPESLQPQYQYVWSQRYIDAPVLRDKNTDTDGLCDDSRVYYLGDANFNVTKLVNTGGDAIERYVYTPYGELTIHDATWSNIRSVFSYDVEYTYTGRRLDGETGLYYYRHRIYAAQLGRFGSRDPLGYEAGANIYEYGIGRPLVYLDPFGWFPVDTIWDIASVIYDAGTITVGIVTNNPTLVANGTVDITTDLIALAIPYVPAGASKVARVVRAGSKAARETVATATSLTIKVRAIRRSRRVVNESVVRGRELVTGMKEIFKDDVVGTGVTVVVKSCDGTTVKAEIDLLLKHKAYELKNWANIRPGEARTITAQIERQMEVVKHIEGNPVTHGGLIINSHTVLSGATRDVFRESGIPVWRRVEGTLEAVVTVD